MPLERKKQEDQGFKASLSYIANSMPTWLLETVSQTNKNDRQELGVMPYDCHRNT